MSVPTSIINKDALKAFIATTANIKHQPTATELIADTLRLGEGVLTNTGALSIQTGEFTGRSPKDKFIVKDAITQNTVHWNDFNIAIDEKYFFIVKDKIMAYLANRNELWVRNCYACADPKYRLNITIINEKPAINLFAYNMFLRPTQAELVNFKTEWTILSAPGLMLNAAECGTRQHNAAIVSFTHKTILIAGTGYTGETKKGIFTILNYLMPTVHNVLSMHCSANIGKAGDTAVFFGLSGTGKTTLSADPTRKLIGDDEHGWSDEGIFNFEGGCYAKTIGLNADKEPDIFNAIKPGAILENISFKPGTNIPDYDNGTVTENTRVSYPLDFINNIATPSIGGQPKNIFFLTCDAAGVLPPISRLTAAQAMYQFISGYTAKIAGTEAGITEPKSTFSACFGAPFLPLHPGKYAKMLGEKITAHKVDIWLINTGWTGGSYGTGNRIKLSYTRAMITAALNNELDNVVYDKHPVFGFEMPTTCPNVPTELLNPRNTWADKNAYDEKANKLALLFIDNFKKYAEGLTTDIIAAAPTLK